MCVTACMTTLHPGLRCDTKAISLPVVLSPTCTQTYTGNILVSVNPYKMCDIYDMSMVGRYHGQLLGKLPP